MLTSMKPLIRPRGSDSNPVTPCRPLERGLEMFGRFLLTHKQSAPAHTIDLGEFYVGIGAPEGGSGVCPWNVVIMLPAGNRRAVNATFPSARVNQNRDDHVPPHPRVLRSQRARCSP